MKRTDIEMMEKAAADRRIEVPHGFRKELSEMIESMDAAEKIVTSGKSRAMRTATWIMSVAAGLVLLIGTGLTIHTFRTPKDTFTDPEEAYAAVEKALTEISGKMSGGAASARQAEETVSRHTEVIRSLY